MAGVALFELDRISNRDVRTEATFLRVDANSSSRPRRLIGVDVARGVAVLGMYAVHVGPNPDNGGLDALFAPLVGHSSALFAVLAGVSIALMSGACEPVRGWKQGRVALRLATRAVLLVLLGLWLSSLDTGYLVILAYYGVCFLLILPFLRLPTKALAITALLTAIVVPPVSYLLRSAIAPRDLKAILPDVALDGSFPVHGFGQALTILLVTGTFPAINLMSLIFAGLAIGRMRLRSPVVCRRLIIGGASLTAAGYGISWLATDVFGGMKHIYASVAPAAAAAGSSVEQYFHDHRVLLHGTSPTTSWAWQLLPTGASYTAFDLLISIGIAAAVIGGCQLLSLRARRGLSPVANLGGQALSAYVLHFVAIAIIWEKEDDPFGLWNFVAFAMGALVAVHLWRRFVGRGPFEWLLHVLSTWPDKLRVRTSNAQSLSSGRHEYVRRSSS